MRLNPIKGFETDEKQFEDLVKENSSFPVKPEKLLPYSMVIIQQ